MEYLSAVDSAEIKQVFREKKKYLCYTAAAWLASIALSAMLVYAQDLPFTGNVPSPWGLYLTIGAVMAALSVGSILQSYLPGLPNNLEAEAWQKRERRHVQLGIGLIALCNLGPVAFWLIFS